MLPESTIQDIISRILKREGGFTDDPVDHGSRTNFGVTQRLLDSLHAQHLIAAFPTDVADLNSNDARAIYDLLLTNWGIKAIPNADALDLVADCCVNHGASRGVRWLQLALNVTADGVIGPQTLAVALNYGVNWKSVRTAILRQRIMFYAQIVHDRPDQSKFIVGWMNRAVTFL